MIDRGIASIVDLEKERALTSTSGREKTAILAACVSSLSGRNALLRYVPRTESRGGRVGLTRGKARVYRYYADSFVNRARIDFLTKENQRDG